MTQEPIRFQDGQAYERYMGQWSRLAGQDFLAWLAPAPGLRWLDVGCGNGAFTAMLSAHCAPASLDGIDPSEAQLEFARALPALKAASFRAGDAQALPYPDRAFDHVVMPLVIFFLNDPAKGVAQMARVAAPGGTVSSYSWDMTGGGFPYAILMEAMKDLGIPVNKPPNPQASKPEVLQDLWAKAGLRELADQVITVRREFPDFAEFWSTVLGAPSVGATLRALAPERSAALQASLRDRLPIAADGRISLTARAHAIRGAVE